MTFKLLLLLFRHRARSPGGKILHINTTCYPTAEWVVQQLRETFFPENGAVSFCDLGP